MKYRSRIDIIGLVLRSAMRGATKTRLMYGAFLSYAQLKEYLSYMEQKDLVLFDHEQSIYRLTPRGLQFLNVYEELKELIESETKREPMALENPTQGLPEYPFQLTH